MNPKATRPMELLARKAEHVPDDNPAQSRQTALIFNSAIGAAAIAAAFELGLLDELREEGAVASREFCRRRALNQSMMAGVLRVLTGLGVVGWNAAEDQVRPGPIFEDALRDKGYFLWLVRGYGGFWQNLADIVSGKSSADAVRRDGRCIAMAASDYGAQFVDPVFMEMLATEPYRCAADIGCGSAERLVEMAKARPDFRGIGIDINPDAVNLSRRRVEEEGLQNRITLVEGDIAELGARPEFDDVELLFSFFMAHDLWPRENCLRTLRNIRAIFPSAERLLLSDTYRSEAAPSFDGPIFTSGFELTHALMGQYIPSLAEWMSLFEEAGWECVEQRAVGIPSSSIFDLRPS